MSVQGTGRPVTATNRFCCEVLAFYAVSRAPAGTVEEGEKKDFVPRVTLGKIINQQNLELL